MNLPQASNFSAGVDQLTLILFVVSSIIIVIVFGLLITFSIRYRTGSKADRSNPPEKSRKIEILVAGTILLFGIFMFVGGSKLYYRMYTAPENARTVYVTAKQWMWKFHTDDNKEINEITLTKDKPVRFVMISEDVIHSFFVPAFRVKQDVLPSTYSTLWFTPTETGDFLVLCTQFCGLSHSDMRAVIHVVEDKKENHASNH